MRHSVHLKWKSRTLIVLPVIGGVVAAAVGIRVLIAHDFSSSAWEFMGRCGADSLGFFLVAGMGWLQFHETNERS